MQSYDTLTAASTTEEEEQSAGEVSPEHPRTRGWRPRDPQEGAPRRRPALKGGSMRRMPQMDRIAESSGSQPSVKEEDMLQVCAPDSDLQCDMLNMAFHSTSTLIQRFMAQFTVSHSAS